MDFTVWYGENIQEAEYIVANTVLSEHSVHRKVMYNNNSKDFVKNPESIKAILYLDKPNLIITGGKPEKPLLAIEFCGEAGTGHNFFQRVGRVAAAAEFEIPFAYVLPEKVWKRRQTREGWDWYNPLIFRVLLQMGSFHRTPILAFIWAANQTSGDPENRYLICDAQYHNLPATSHNEMTKLFQFINLCISYYIENRPFVELAFEPFCQERLHFMSGKYHERVSRKEAWTQWSPLTSCHVIETAILAQQLSLPLPALGDLLASRPETVVYNVGTTTFRGDPYAGALVAIDYLMCRKGPSFENRYRNLAINFQNAGLEQLLQKSRLFYERDCPLARAPSEGIDIPYLMLHLREGCKYTKQKELRVFCFFADIILFRNGLLHRYG